MTRAIAAAGGTQQVAAPKVREGRGLYAPIDPVSGLDDAQKVRILETIEKFASAQDPRVKQVIARLSGEYDVVPVARSDGTLAADVRPLVHLSVSVIVEHEGRREQGSSGGGGRFGYGYFSDPVLLGIAKEEGRNL